MTNFRTRTTEAFRIPAELNQYLVGFDHLFDDALCSHNSSERKYPPCNITHSEDKTEYYIELAIAGFSKEELSIHVSPDNTLIIKGEKSKKSNKNYIHRGLSNRNFDAQAIIVQSCGQGYGAFFGEVPPYRRCRLRGLDSRQSHGTAALQCFGGHRI